MSLFGSSTKTYYNSTSFSLYDTDAPSLTKQTVAAAITQNRNIASDLIANVTNGTAYNANRLYMYAKGGTYPWGLPNGSATVIAPQNPENIKQIIQEEEEQPIELVFVGMTTDTITSHIIYTAEYFLLLDTSQTIKSWTYDESTEVYPVLNIRNEDYLEVSPYYPIIPIRVNNEYLAESGKDTALPIKTACRFLGLKPDELNDAMSEDPDNLDNPVEDAFVFIGTEISDDTQHGLNYLYEYFSHMYGVSTITKADYEYWDTNKRNSGIEPPINRVTLEDSNYKMELGWLYISRNILEGVVCPVGEYVSSIDLNGDQRIGSVQRASFYSKDVFYIRKQVTSTSYVEYEVVGLVHSNWAVGKELRTTLEKAFDEEEVNPSFIIPLRRDIARRLGMIGQHELMNSSIRLLVNDEFVQKLKWYQRGIFKVILIIVAVVLSIAYPPAGIAAFSAAAAGIAIVSVIAMQLLFPIVYKELQNLLGEELALVVAVIAIAYGVNVFQATTFGISEGINLYVSSALEDIQAELLDLDEKITDLEEEERNRQQDVWMASKMVSGDAYAILEPSKYVSRFFMDSRLPMMMREAVHSYTDVMRFTDKPDSYIRLGHTGA